MRSPIHGIKFLIERYPKSAQHLRIAGHGNVSDIQEVSPAEVIEEYGCLLLGIRVVAAVESSKGA